MSLKINVYRGTAYPVIYNHTDTAGAAVSLVGKTLYFRIKSDVYDSDATDATALIAKTVTSGSHSNAAGGISGFTLTDTDTYIDPGKYHFVFLIEDEATHLTEPPTVYGEFIVKGQPANAQVGNGE